MKLPTTCLTALLAASSFSQVAAGPNGASNCVFGGPSVGNTHLSSTNVTNGTLADGGFNVAIGESVASPGMPITVTEGTDVNITVDGGTFRGVLIRIEGTTSDMVTPVDPLRVATNCPDDAAAATHSERSDKTSVSATFSGLPVGSHKVDVDVVVENINDVSTYYYGAVDLTVEEPVVPSPALPATVVDVVVGEPDLSVLVAAVTQAGLVDTLSATTTNYTVFAPVNASLATLDPKFLTDNWKLHLIRILQYHVVGGAAVEKAAVTDGQDVPTLAPNEDPIKARTSMGDLFFSGPAFTDSKVIEADLKAGNGIVHKVDQFFLPEILTIDLLSAASNVPQGFEQVATILEFSDLQDEIRADGRTIFTPSDFAFNKAENQYLLPAIQADPSLVDKILSNHLAIGVYPAAMMLSPDFTELEMLSGQIFPITTGGFGNRLRPVINGIEVSVADNIAGNGVAHVIDDVLLEGVFTNNIVDVVSNETDLTTLVAAVTQAGLVEALADETTNYTVFAPVDSALETLDPKFLTDNWKLHLTYILLYHVVGGAAVEKAAVTDGQLITTLARNEGNITATLSMGDLFLSGAAFTDSKVIEADLMADNGIIHKVDQLFLPFLMTTDLLGVAANIDGFDQVATILAASNLQDEIKADGRTIFAPSNFAFEQNQELLPQIQADPSLVDKILANHLAIGVFPAAMLLSPDFTELEMYSGRVFPITTGGFGNRLRPAIDGIEVSVADNIAGNGIAHVIDDVLLEGVFDPEPTASPVEGDSPTAAPVVGSNDEPTDDSGAAAVVSTVLGFVAAGAMAMLF